MNKYVPPRKLARCREKFHTNDVVSRGISCFSAGCYRLIYIDVEGITIGQYSLNSLRKKKHALLAGNKQMLWKQNVAGHLLQKLLRD